MSGVVFYCGIIREGMLRSVVDDYDTTCIIISNPPPPRARYCAHRLRKNTNSAFVGDTGTDLRERTGVRPGCGARRRAEGGGARRPYRGIG